MKIGVEGEVFLFIMEYHLPFPGIDTCHIFKFVKYKHIYFLNIGTLIIIKNQLL